MEKDGLDTRWSWNRFRRHQTEMRTAVCLFPVWSEGFPPLNQQALSQFVHDCLCVVDGGESVCEREEDGWMGNWG